MPNVGDLSSTSPTVFSFENVFGILMARRVASNPGEYGSLAQGDIENGQVSMCTEPSSLPFDFFLIDPIYHDLDLIFRVMIVAAGRQ